MQNELLTREYRAPISFRLVSYVWVALAEGLQRLDFQKSEPFLLATIAKDGVELEVIKGKKRHHALRGILGPHRLPICFRM